MVISSIAVLIGLVLVNVFRPGEGMSDEVRALARTSVVPKAAAAPGDTSPAALLVSIVPDNPVKAAANGDYLGLIFFALVFGIALGLTRTPATERLKEVIAGLYEVTLVLIGGVLKVAPLGVAALLFGHDRAPRLRRAPPARGLRGRGAARARAAHVRRLLALGALLRRAQPGAVLPRRADGGDHRVLHRVVERHPAHRAQGGRGEPHASRPTSPASCSPPARR